MTEHAHISAAPAPVEKVSAEELTESLTGFDEIAIEKRFGAAMDKLTGTMPARALVFILKRRDGLGDEDAYRASMEMPMGGIDDLFEDAEDEVIPGEPVTAAGKDASQPA